MSEKHIEHQIRQYLDSIGAWHIKTHGNMFSRAGTPDVIAVVKGKFVAIEVKRPGGRVSPLQAANIELIKKAGGIAFVSYSLEETKEYFRKEHLI